MRLRVENLGPLREADVDLSQDLIVLTGPNNTGKTWFAWTVYALMRAASRTSVPSALVQSLTPEKPSLSLTREQYEPLAAQLVESATAKVTEDLPGVFAASRRFFDAARLHWRVLDRRTDNSPIPLAERGEVAVYSRGWAVHGSWPESGEEMRLYVGPEPEAEALRADRGSIASSASLALALMCRAVCGLQKETTLFPAERLAVNLFARELAASRSELVEEFLAADERGQDATALIRRAGRFPLPIRDSLSIATRLDALSRHESTFADLATELENSLLGGAIRASEHGELHFAPRDSNVSLPVHMTASVVKSLASLVFYFRYLAEPEAFLIIDEPELNLHPDAQRKVARFLGKVVNRGFKVMISTHSDFVVRELSHLVMLGHAGDAGRSLAQELGYDHGALLTPDKVGAWLFNEGTAARIPVDGTGFGVRTIDDEISHMNADSQRIYARLVG